MQSLPGKSGLLWYTDMFDTGGQAVQIQAFVQFVVMTQKENWSEDFGFDVSYPGFRSAKTRACPQSLGKRCVLAHAMSSLSTPCIVTGPKFLISSVRVSSRPAAFPFFSCFNGFCSSMIVKSSSKSWFSWPYRLIMLCRCMFGILPFRMS